MNDSIDENTRKMYIIGINFPYFDDLFSFNNCNSTSHCNFRVEVARGTSEHEITGAIRDFRLNERNISVQRSFHYESLTIEFAKFLVF